MQSLRDTDPAAFAQYMRAKYGDPHTPGPWIIGDENDPLVFSPAAGAYVAQVLAYDGGSLRQGYAADAALIAAAPDLLAALRQIEAATVDGGTVNTIARAAIARATGGGK